MELADVVAVVEAERPSNGVDRDPLGHSTHVLVECTSDEIKVAKDERLLRVESHRNDIQRVGLCIPFGIVDLDFLRVHEFLSIAIISHVPKTLGEHQLHHPST